MVNKRDSEIYYFVNDFRDDDNQVPKEKNYLLFKFSESVKFKIKTENLKRSVEVFKVDPVDPFNTVARFHKPCVRAYLQNNTFHMLPSFITSMMTMINIDYKYFAGSHDPVKIINKYRMRGYSLIANPNEKKGIYMYNENINEMNGMFKVINNEEQFGPKNLNDKIFKPMTYLKGLPESIYVPSKHTYFRSTNNVHDYYKKEYKKYGVDFDQTPINILNFTSIGKNGCMSPVQTWVQEAFYNFVNSNL